MPTPRDESPCAVVVGVGSVIGQHIANRLTQDGWFVAGTARPGTDVAADVHDLTRCDLGSYASVSHASWELRQLTRRWSLFVIVAGTMSPIGPFFEVSADDWEHGIQVNTLSPLRLLRELWQMRDSTVTPMVCFLAGGGTNSDFPSYSAYCISKIMLIKAVELLQSEEPSTKFVILGPGYVRTPIHDETLAAGRSAGLNLDKTLKLLDGPGTDLEAIYQHLMKCYRGPTETIGGRNFSTAHDAWQDDTMDSLIASEPLDAFRLRRFPFSHVK